MDAHKPPKTDESSRLLRVEEAAVALSVCPATIRRWCGAGLLEGVTLPRRGLRVTASSVLSLARPEGRS